MRILLLLLLTSPLFAETDEAFVNRRYFDLLTDSERVVLSWNPEMKDAERKDFIESTLVGFGDNHRKALVYLAVCAQESNFRWIFNADGCGYSGTKWPTLINSAKAHGMRRPFIGWRAYFAVNKRRANYYAALAFDDWTRSYTRGGRVDYKEVVKVWHRSQVRGAEQQAEANRYCRSVMQILGLIVMMEGT